MRNYWAFALALTLTSLTGCFESELETQFKAALAEQDRVYMDGYEVDDVEFTSEEVETRGGYTMTSRNFVMEYDLAKDVIDTKGRYKDALLVVYPEKTGPYKAAGTFRVATDGVDTEYDIKFNKRDWDTGLTRKSLKAEEYNEFVEVGSAREKELTAEVSAALEEKQALLKQNEKALDEAESRFDQLTSWRKTPEEEKLIDAVNAAKKLLKAKNDEILDAVNVDYNKELQPIHAQQQAEEKGKGWSERRAIRAKYREIKRGVEEKYQAVYAEKELKTIPELTAAEQAYEQHRERKSTEIASLQKQLDEYRDAIYAASDEIGTLERWIRSATPQEVASAGR